MPNSYQMMQAKLLVVGGSEVEQSEFALSLPATIGRGKENLITLAHPLVSRQHCEIFAHGNGGLMVRDLGSLNGTYVGSERIEGDHELQPGDLLTVGIVTFRVIVPQDERTEMDPGLDSVLDGEPTEAPEDETRLDSGEWASTAEDAETETLRSSSSGPNKPK